MLKPSSSVAALTLAAFVQSQSSALRANPILLPEPVQKPLTPSVAYPPYTLYLGQDPYSQAMLKLQYNQEEKMLEWQLLNNGYVLSSQSHPMPGNILTVDNGLVYNGDLIIVTGITTGQRWFIYALNSQGEFQWQRQGRGHIEDLAFSDNGDSIYAVGSSRDHPLLLAVTAQSGEIKFHSGADKVVDDDDAGVSYRQIVVTGDKELVIAQHREVDGQLQLTQWRAAVDAVTGEDKWGEDAGFCKGCSQIGVKAVALQYDREQRRLYSVTSDGRQLALATRNPLDGQSLSSVQTFPIKAGKGVWDTVLRVEEPGFGQNAGIAGSDSIIGLAETSSRLGLISSGCRLWLGGAVFDGNTLAINACGDNAALLPGRRLLQAENGTEATDEPNRDFPHPEGQAHRVIVEWIGGLIGVIGGISLISGATLFVWSSYQKCKSIVDQTEDDEKERRKEERGRINKLEKTKSYQFFNLYRTSKFIYPFGNNIQGSMPEAGTVLTPDNSQVENSEDQLDIKTKLSLERMVVDMIHAGVDSRVAYNQREINRAIGEQKRIDDVFEAAKVGNVREVLSLVGNDKQLVNAIDDKGNTILHYLCIMFGSADDVRILLSYGAQCNCSNNDGYTPLLLAVANGRHPNLIATLLDCQPQISQQEISEVIHILSSKKRQVLTSRGGTQIDINAKSLEEVLQRRLHESLMFDHFDRFRRLRLSSGFNNRKRQSSLSDGGLTILHEAAQSGNVGIIDIIIAFSLVGIDAEDDNGNTALHYASLHDSTHDYSVVNALLNHYPNINAQNFHGDTPLHYAIYRGEKDLVGLLLEKKEADVDLENQQKIPPLFLIARKTFSCDLVQLAASKSMRDRNSSGQTCLHSAASVLNAHHNIAPVIEAKKSRGFIDQRDRSGFSALRVALYSRNVDFACHLVLLGARIKSDDVELDRKQKLGCFVFAVYRIAIDNTFTETEKRLLIRKVLDAGFDINERDNGGNSPLDLIVEDENFSDESVVIAIELGANIDAINDSQETLLIKSVLGQREIGILKRILGFKANVNARNDEGNTALHVAAKKNLVDVVSMLIRQGADISVENNDGLTPLQLTTDSSIQAIFYSLSTNPQVATVDQSTQQPLLTQSATQSINKPEISQLPSTHTEAVETLHPSEPGAVTTISDDQGSASSELPAISGEAATKVHESEKDPKALPEKTTKL